jgi:RNA polymerase sigma-70 factor (ECF subfamily)
MSARDFADIYDEHVWRVYAFFAYRLSSRADAEDLTQQTFERALRAWRSFDGSEASVATWLFVIARNLLIDHRRTDRAASLVPSDAGEVDLLPARPDPVRIGLEPALEQSLAQLTPRERELIALRFGGDLTGPEIAQLTGLTLANVQQILSRALRRLRSILDRTAAGAGRTAAPVRMAAPGAELAGRVRSPSP